MDYVQYGKMLKQLKEESKFVVDNYGMFSTPDKYDTLQYLIGDLTEYFDGFTPNQINDWFATVRNAFVEDACSGEDYYKLLKACAIPITRKALNHLRSREQVNALMAGVKVSRHDFDNIISANLDVEAFQEFSLSEIYRLMRNHKFYVELAHEHNLW